MLGVHDDVELFIRRRVIPKPGENEPNDLNFINGGSSKMNEFFSPLFTEKRQLNDYFTPFTTEKRQFPESTTVICTIKKVSSKNQPLILQGCVLQDQRLVYVPVFYNLTQSRKWIKMETLIENYYLFVLKKGVEMATKASTELLQEKNLVLPAPDVTRQLLLDSPPQAMDAVVRPNFTLLLDAYHTNDSLAMLITKGREFKKFEIDMIQKKPLWKFDCSNLNESSFELDIFKEDSHVVEVRISGNF